jgi:hypothetical protein
MRFVLSSFGPEQNRCVLLLRRRTKPKQILLSVTELPWQQASALTLFLLALGALLPFGGLRAIDVWDSDLLSQPGVKSNSGLGSQPSQGYGNYKG